MPIIINMTQTELCFAYLLDMASRNDLQYHIFTVGVYGRRRNSIDGATILQSLILPPHFVTALSVWYGHGTVRGRAVDGAQAQAHVHAQAQAGNETYRCGRRCICGVTTSSSSHCTYQPLNDSVQASGSIRYSYVRGQSQSAQCAPAIIELNIILEYDTKWTYSHLWCGRATYLNSVRLSATNERHKEIGSVSTQCTLVLRGELLLRREQLRRSNDYQPSTCGTARRPVLVNALQNCVYPHH